jgi:hypothetical protein
MGALKAALSEVDPTRIALELRTALTRDMMGGCAQCGKPTCAKKSTVDETPREGRQDSDEDSDDDDWLDDPALASMMSNRMAQLQTHATRDGSIEDATEEVVCDILLTLVLLTLTVAVGSAAAVETATASACSAI